MTWTAYGLLISYWSSDVCSSDLIVLQRLDGAMHAALKVGFVVGWHRALPVLDDRRRAFAAEHLAEVAALADVEDDDRDIVVAAKGDGTCIHDAKVVAQHLVEAYFLIALGVRHLFQIGRAHV